MSECVLCGRTFSPKLSLARLVSLTKIKRSLICPQCFAGFEKITYANACWGCGRKQSGRTLCKDCCRWQQKGYELLENKACYVYDEPHMKKYFACYKFTGDYQLGTVFQTDMRQQLEWYLKRKWLLVVIPVDEETYQKRGFNQVCGLLPQVKLNSYLRHRQKMGRKKQSHKNRQERLQVPQPFSYVGPMDLKQQNILLLDDIYTTGSTLYHASALLHEHNSGKIKSVTLAR